MNKTLPLDVNPTDGASMVWVPGSSVAFTMGLPFDVGSGEPPMQRVTLSGFWMYKYEVTVAQYCTFCFITSRALPSFPTGFSWACKSGWDDPLLQQHPIVNVDWYDAENWGQPL